MPFSYLNPRLKLLSVCILCNLGNVCIYHEARMGPQAKENNVLMMGKGELRVVECMWDESRSGWWGLGSDDEEKQGTSSKEPC